MGSFLIRLVSLATCACVFSLAAAQDAPQPKVEPVAESPAPKSGPVLIRAMVAGKVVIGDILRESEQEIDLFDIKSGRQRTLAKGDLQAVRRNMREGEVQTAVGFPAFLAWKTKRVLPARDPGGTVAKVDGSTVYVSLHPGMGIRRGGEVVISRHTEQVLDPNKGDELGAVRKEIARGVVQQVLGNQLCQVAIHGNPAEPVQVGDVVGSIMATKPIAVLPLEDASGNESEAGKKLSEELTTAFVKYGISVVERTLLEKVLREQAALQDGKAAGAVGRRLDAYAVLSGTLIPQGRLLEARLRLIRVDTGEILFAGAGRVPGSEVGKQSATAESKTPKPVQAPPSPKEKSFTNSIGMQFVLIPAGEFLMGSQQHVKITRPFYLGLYEVTQGEYAQIMGSNPSGFTAKGNDVAKVLGKDTRRHPVEMTTWNEAMEFCKRLSMLPTKQAARLVYRLPTEAEWEYACRAGSTTKWSFGDDPAALDEYAWFAGNSGGMTHPVGLKRPNAWGLYDMHGNIRERCMDYYGRLPQTPAVDPVGAVESPGPGGQRVTRGGDWFSDSEDTMSASRRFRLSRGRNNYLGFRVVLVVPE